MVCSHPVPLPVSARHRAPGKRSPAASAQPDGLWASCVAGLCVAGFCLAGLALAPTAHAQEATKKRRSAVTARATVKVIHPIEVRKALIARAKALGGFLTLVTNQRLVLKVPPQKADILVAAAAAHGFLLERSIEREDLTERIGQLEAQRRSKREILKKLRGLLERGGVRATLDVERSMTRLVAELETVEGQLRVAKDRSRWAVVDLSFQYRQRARSRSVRSPFGWVNTVDLERFLNDF